MEESGPAVLDRPSPGLSLAPVQQLKRKQGKLHKKTSSCSLAALTGGWGDSWAICNFVCAPMLCLMCDLYMWFVSSSVPCVNVVSFMEPVTRVEGVTVLGLLFPGKLSLLGTCDINVRCIYMLFGGIEKIVFISSCRCAVTAKERW